MFLLDVVLFSFVFFLKKREKKKRKNQRKLACIYNEKIKKK